MSVNPLLSVEDLVRIEAASDASLSPDGETVAYCLSSVDPERDRQRDEVRFAPAIEGSGDRSPQLSAEGRAPRWSPDGDSVAILRDGDGDVELLLLSPLDGGERVLASFGGEVGAAVWAPAGDRIAVTVASPPGSASRIAILDAVSGAIDLVPGGEGDDDISPSWSPDGTRLAFSRGPHDPGEEGPGSRIWVAPAEAGRKPDAIDCDLAFACCPSWSPDGKTLACYGTRDPRLGLEDPALQPWLIPAASGSAKPAATGINGAMVSNSPEGPIWSRDGSWIFFREARDGDINAVQARAGDAGDVRTLTRDCQLIDISLSRDGRRLAVCVSAPTDPGSAHLLDLETGQRTPVVHGSQALAFPRTTRRRFQSPDGGELDGWLQGLRPELSPQPLLVSMHGGPHNFVGPGFSLGHFHRSVLASRGWIVLTLNPSGSGSYGQAFADSLRGKWGERDLAEYLAAVDALVGEGLADPERLAVAGYSYGGYLAASAICRTSRFKAAVIGAPITNLESFQRSSDIAAWWIPWEMGDLAASDEHLRRISPVNGADRIATPTLILHGEEDRRCPIAQGEELHARIAAAGRTQVEMVRYPGAGHLFYSRGRPSERIDYNRRIVEWIEEQVPGSNGKRSAVDGQSLDGARSAEEVRR